MKYLEHLVNMGIFKRILFAKRDIDRAANCYLLFVNRTNKVFAYVKTKKPFIRIEVFKRNCKDLPITIDSFESFAMFQRSSRYESWEVYQSNPVLDETPLDVKKFIEDTGYKYLERLTNPKVKKPVPAGKRLYQITASSTTLEYYVYDSELSGNKTIVNKVRRALISRTSSLIGNERNTALNKNWPAIRKAFIMADFYNVKIISDTCIGDLDRADRAVYIRNLNKNALIKATLEP